MEGFAKRLKHAREDFADSLEDLAFDIVKELKAGQNPILLQHMLNAYKPELYRTPVANDEKAVAAVKEFKAALREERRKAKAERAGAAEAKPGTQVEQVLDAVRRRGNGTQGSGTPQGLTKM